MIISTIIFLTTCLLMVLSVLFMPKITIKKFSVDTYWVVTLLGAIIMVLVSKTDISFITSNLLKDSAINPVKILILFISMTILSVFLDELGFFGYLANVTLKKAKTSQTKLFIYLYVAVSILTVFTSNDVIILSFTPFICYFCKNAKISPLPYLTAEFIAANTLSMALIIGNPTNIYLATSYGFDFLGYFKIMFLPTLFSGITAFIVLYLLFRKKLKEQINGEADYILLSDKLSLSIGLIHLSVCTVLLAISSYINLEMWIVSLVSVISLFTFSLIINICRGHKPYVLKNCVIRAPFQLIPFVLSMFIMIIVLEDKGITSLIASFIGTDFIVFKYGVLSFLSANVINNIPMSALFSSIASTVSIEYVNGAVFASIIGSNLGAFLTPIGALAGIMWNNILKNHGVKYGYLDFIKTGAIVALPTLIVALITLNIVI